MITSNLLFCIKHSYDEDYFGVEHSHPCYEIVYYCAGEGEVSFSEKEYHFQKNTFMVCGPNVKHIEHGKKGTEVLYIGFELFGEAELPEGLFEDADYGILEYLEKIYCETKHWTAYSYQLINLFCTVIAVKLAARRESGREAAINHNFDNIVGYISANFQEDLNVRKLARMAGYSYDHFRKMFVQKLHVTVNDFLLRKRIDAATEMLKSGKYLIKEVAADCGFSSVAQFCTKYREVVGVTPKQMQEKAKGEALELEKDKFSK